MKKVIFICLLSLSVCLSKPAEQQTPVAPALGQPQNVPPADPKVQPPKAAEQAPITVPVHNEAQITEAVKPVAQPTSNATQTATAPAANEAKPNETKTEEKDNKTNEKKDDKPAQGKDQQVIPAKDDKSATTNGTADNKNVIQNGTKPDGKGDDKKEVTTPKTEVSSKASETPGDIHIQARGFDGPSFIGGIILTLGLLAIGFMGFKYYKNQTERNYHTL